MTDKERDAKWERETRKHINKLLREIFYGKEESNSSDEDLPNNGESNTVRGRINDTPEEG